MVTFSNKDYSGDEVANGVYVPGSGHESPTFSGSNLFGSNQSIKLDGTFNKAGDKITATCTSFFGKGHTGTVTYDGYFLQHGVPVYVFTAFAIGGFQVSFAVSTIACNFTIDCHEKLISGVPCPTCFLRGSRLQTVDGEVAIERLAVGDLVATRVHGDTIYKPITWIGHRELDVADYDGDIDSYPVRIRAHAFAENVPHRDLLLTSEHCIFVEGKLIPVRMLVNGGSIIVDTAIRQYEYFHVELENHAILVAEGLETESYIDTGNRGNFANAPQPSIRTDFAAGSRQKSWDQDAAAALTVLQEAVQPIWQRLKQRADTLGLRDSRPKAGLVTDADLRLVTDGNVEILPTLCDGKIYAFAIPSQTRSIRLVSRVSRPSDTIGPYVDDRRALGVLVGKIGISLDCRRIPVGAHLAQSHLMGWHALEDDASYRWTNGNAVLPLDPILLAGNPVFLDIEILRAGPYIAEPARSLAA